MTKLTCPACARTFEKRTVHHVYCSVTCCKRIYMRTYRINGKGKYGRGCTR